MATLNIKVIISVRLTIFSVVKIDYLPLNVFNDDGSYLAITSKNLFICNVMQIYSSHLKVPNTRKLEFICK